MNKMKLSKYIDQTLLKADASIDAIKKLNAIKKILSTLGYDSLTNLQKKVYEELIYGIYIIKHKKN